MWYKDGGEALFSESQFPHLYNQNVTLGGLYVSSSSSFCKLWIQDFTNQIAETSPKLAKWANRNIAFRLEATLKPHNPSSAYYKCPLWNLESLGFLEVL